MVASEINRFGYRPWLGAGQMAWKRRHSGLLRKPFKCRGEASEVHGKCHGVGQPVVRRCACSSAQRRRTSPKCKTVLAKLPAEIVDQTGDAARAADGQSPPNRPR